MYSQIKNIPVIKETIALTPERVLITCGILLLLSYGIYMQAIFTSQDLNLKAGPPVGGDFVAFWSAARASFAGMASEIYQASVFEQYLLDNAMPREKFGLTWQYPPTYYLFIFPLAAISFLPAYFLWSVGGLILFSSIFKKLFNFNMTALLVFVAAPIMFNSVITGQNGFITASLLVLAVSLPDKRPLMAGIAAGLLTVKPQLGILIPFAFIAGGYWRSFFAAAATALIMITVSIGFFGVESWIAFFESILNVGGGVKNSVYPIHKMPTVFAALVKTGVSSDIAMIVQAISLLFAIGLVSFTWRVIKAWDIRAAILCSAVFLCSPYAYYYEMTVLALPIVVIVARAYKSGWFKGEEILCAFAWITPLFLPGVSGISGAQLGLLIVLTCLGLSLRRAIIEDELKLPFPTLRPKTA